MLDGKKIHIVSDMYRILNFLLLRYSLFPKKIKVIAMFSVSPLEYLVFIDQKKESVENLIFLRQ
jgi:hypothetical protein